MVGKISFQGVKTEFDAIPAGAYEAKFVSWKETKVKPGAQNAGADAFNLQFAITEEGDYKNRRFFRFCVFTEDSLWAFKRAMSALGAMPDWEDPEGVDPSAIAKSVLNNSCVIKVTYDPEGFEDPVTHEKKPSNSIADIVPSEATQLAAAEARQATPEAEPAGRRR